MLVNLFDDTFRHATCSTGWKTPRHIQYVRDQMEWDGITLFVDGYVNSPIVDRVKSKYKVGWLHEPQCLHPENYLVMSPERFDIILTYYGPLLAAKSMQWGFRFAPYGGTWIPREHWGLRPKTKLVSMLYGDKRATEGHRIRHEIANAVRPLGIVDFYGFEGEAVDYSPETKLKVLGDYAFSIVTEACWQENLFTELLLDCFTVGTIPIFWGCPNVGEFFNYDGIIDFTSDNIEAGNFGPEFGWWMTKKGWEVYNWDIVQAGIKDNLNRVAGYEITEDWLYTNILRELDG